MRHVSRWLLVPVLAATLAGCVSFVPPDDYRVSAPRSVEMPDPEHAQVVFLWTPDKQYRDAALPVHQGKMMIGALKVGTYFAHTLAPGNYVFSVPLAVSSKDTELIAEAGNTYFVEFIAPGVAQAGSLRVIHGDIARVLLANLNMITWSHRDHQE